MPSPGVPSYGTLILALTGEQGRLRRADLRLPVALTPRSEELAHRSAPRASLGLPRAYTCCCRRQVDTQPFLHLLLELRVDLERGVC